MAQSTAAEDTGRLSVSKLLTQLSDYRTSKREEREEGDEADRYYHGSQWDAAEITQLNDRHQPVITYNREAPKINGIIGLIERLKQDPKAYPRTPPKEAAQPQMPPQGGMGGRMPPQAPGAPPMGHNGGPAMGDMPDAPDGAEIATTVLNYILDSNRWKDIAPDIGRDAAIGPVGGIELDLVEGDQGDPDIGIEPLDRRGFFYDPRARRADFSDARYMGQAKWVDLDLAVEMFPDREAELRRLATSGESNQGNEDVGNSQNRAFIVSNERSVYLAEHYYIRKGLWYVCCYAGSVELLHEESPYPCSFGRRKNGPRYIAFSAFIDHDGDRYGFHRNFKGPQDEINHRRSRGIHALNTKRLVITGGTVHDPEEIRKEYHRPDGVVILPVGAEVKVEDNAALAQGNLEMLTEAKNEIENFGPNAELVGQSSDAKSGRAIALMQQAGIAQLGPYLVAYRAFKLRVYRAAWLMAQQNWTNERMIRVTDDDGLAGYLSLNKRGVDLYGNPTLANVLGSLDVDIILDEGPDQINSMADAFDTLTALMQSAPPSNPAEAAAMREMVFELSSLPGSIKKKMHAISAKAQQPNPIAEQVQQIQMAGEAAKVDLTKAQTMKAAADAQRAGPQPEAVDPEARAYDLADKAAGIDLKRAQAVKTQAEAGKAQAQPQIEAQRTNDQRATDANKMMLELAKLEQQAAEAQQGSVEREYASRGGE